MRDVAVELAHDGGGHGLGADRFRIIFRIDEVVLLSFATEKFPIKRSEKPGLDLRFVAQLMAFLRPKEKGLLGQIGRVGFPAAERERETIEWHVKIFDQLFEVESRHAARVKRRG